MAQKQRKAERTRTRVRASVTKAPDGKTMTGFTRNISRDGLFIETRVTLPPGTELDIELHYPDRTLELEGTVVRAERAPAQLQAALRSGMGVRLRSSEAVSEAAGTSRNRRVSVGSDVVVFFGSERHLLKLHDLSASGAAFLSPSTLPDITFVRLHFKLPPSNEVIEVEGVPVGSREHEGMTLIAINFLDPPEGFVQRIQSLLSERGDSEEE